MNCKEWEERIALYAGGDVTPAETASVEKHMADCAQCRSFAAKLREQLSMLRAVHDEPIADAHFTALRTRVLSELNRVQPDWWRRRWIYAAGVAGIAILAILVAPRHRIEAPRPPQVAIQPAPEKASVADAAVNPAVRPLVRHTRPRRLVASRAPVGPPEPADPMVIKLMTNDPDVVIYWIGK